MGRSEARLLSDPCEALVGSGAGVVDWTRPMAACASLNPNRCAVLGEDMISPSHPSGAKTTALPLDSNRENVDNLSLTNTDSMQPLIQ